MSCENVSAEPEIGRAHGIDGRAASIGHLQSPKMAAEPENGRAHGIDGRAASNMAETNRGSAMFRALPCALPEMAEHMAEPENVEYVRLT